MSSRALRRLQKEQLELETHNSSDEESDYEAPPKAKNLFDLLNEGDDAEEEEEDGDNDDDSKSVQVQQKDTTIMANENQQPIKSAPAQKSQSIQPLSTNNNNKSKKNKKNKKKQQKKAASNAKKDVSELSMQELDDMLDHLKTTDASNNRTDTAYATEAASNDPETRFTHASRQLLCVNYRYLDADAEMKRMFGSRVVNREARPSGRLLKKTKLATPKVDWPSFQKQGLTMESLDSSGDKDATATTTTQFAFKHQEIYQDIQLDYLNVITQHDPNGLVMLTHQHPYHVDSLLQLSEIAKQQGDWTVAGDCIDRALYASERGFHPHFNLGSGNVRLPYQRSENRSFFIAMVRHIQFLTRRGCWRTAFEFNKLLFSLSPFADPTGALLSMDYYALSAREYHYVLEFGANWQADGETYPKDILLLPNFAYSTAYAKFKSHQQQTNVNETKDDDFDADGSNMLRNAIAKFPGFVPQLLEALGESDGMINQHVSFFTSTSTDSYLTLLLAIYIDRTHELWKEPEVLSWLKSNAQHVLKDPSYHSKGLTEVTRQHSSDNDTASLPSNICRHVLLLDRREILSMLPRSVTNTTYYANDPLPPPDSTTGYDLDERMRTRRNNRRNDNQQGGILAMLQGLLGGGQLGAAERQRIRQAMDHFTANIGTGDQIPGAFPGQEDDGERYADDDDNEVSVTATVDDYSHHDTMDGTTSAPDHEDTDYTEEEWQQMQELLGRSESAQGNQRFREIIDSLGGPGAFEASDDSQGNHLDVEDDDLDLQRALAESAQQHQQDMSRRSQQ